MGITINHQYTSELVPVGRYEFIIQSASQDATPAGSGYIGVAAIIRNDVQQNCRNKRIRHQIWMKKEPNTMDIAFGGYNAAQINALCKAAGIPHDKTYSALDELLKDLKGRTFEAELYHDKWNNNVNEKLRDLQSTKVENCTHVWSGANTFEPPPNISIPGEGFVELDVDDDLPF